MQPKTVEIKITLAAEESGSQIDDAVTQLELTDAKEWTVVFCEDVTPAAATTALLDIGVVLRVRGKSETTGDSTIKLRPSRWSQLHPDYFEDREREPEREELKIEADWSGPKRSLATSMTVKWSDARLSAAQAGQLPATRLFSDEQLKFLGACSPGRVNLAAVSLLPPVAATRWDEFKVTGVSSEVRAERWRVDGELDFLELSIVAPPAEAVTEQEALNAFVTDLALPVDKSPLNKTQRVLDYLIAKSLRGQ
ncbi:hypothetical protein [Kribbella sp. NPDC049227]|uniref:hypothetical protein n=1 Tax=Kribbella sp. NPDC049227 TaxID=3364113 RepID=UPI00371D4A59